jgi:hypothetical protein
MLKVESRIADCRIGTRPESLQAQVKRVDAALKADKLKLTPPNQGRVPSLMPAGFFEGPNSSCSRHYRASRRCSAWMSRMTAHALVARPMSTELRQDPLRSFSPGTSCGEKTHQGEFYQENFNEIGAQGKDILKIG